MALKAQSQMIIVALDLVLHISSTFDLRFVEVLVQDLLFKSLLKVMPSLENVKRCYVQCIYIKKEKFKLFLTGFFSLI